MQTDVLVMDFSMAFDKVDHQRLMLELHRLGINSGIITWVKSFLSNRSQTVVLDGEHSDSCPVLSGVPQGSVLGPCLFLMYINGMPDSIKSNIRLFADGTIYLREKFRFYCWQHISVLISDHGCDK